MKTIEDVLFLLQDYDEECEFIAMQDIVGDFNLLSDVIDEGLNWADANGPSLYWIELAEALRNYELNEYLSRPNKVNRDLFDDYSIM